jgi:putative cardiolipin synthase
MHALAETMMQTTAGKLLASLAALAIAAAMMSCSTLRKDFVRSSSVASPVSFDTPTARYVQDEVTQHPDVSGFRLLTNNTNALMSRIVLADHAAHSIDLQTYIFRNDTTGRLIAGRLLDAADRGVRVRLLLDDVVISGEDRFLDALVAHPNIQVRLFNPFRTRSPSLPSKILQFVLEGARLNRRMHNKSFIVDGVIAVMGGRNIGDAYFDASDDSNFRDMDVIAIGPVVPAASSSFDAYWNSDAAYPVEAFRGTRPTANDLARLRESLKRNARSFTESDYAQAANEQLPYGPTADRRGRWFWGSASLIADQPEKASSGKDDPSLRIGSQFREILVAAQKQVLLVSPYFVPGKSGTRFLLNLVDHGVAVSVLTNSLAATDEPAAHAGYAHYRRELLAGKVHLFELRPASDDDQETTARGTSSGVSLHAKAAVIDARYTFVGSMNMDRRSLLFNTEMGVIVDCPELAAAVTRFFDQASSPANAYRVELKPPAHGGSAQLVWQLEAHGQVQELTHEPQATLHRRIQVTLFRLLPIEDLL